ncbi:MAG: pilus assembly protein PilM [Candidatus Omnitrophota bacterium]|nr:pilus assembly protein PilM [Candidatus Omnitrophota bacterium]
MAVGIDIGTYSIKLIELQEKKGKLELLKCAANLVSGDDIKTSLKDILSLSKLSSKRVNVSLSGPSVIVRYIEMPPMKREELRSAIKFEAEKYIPFDIKEAIVDCAVLDKGPSGSTNRILLVAAKKEKVNSYMEMFKELGIDIFSIDVDTTAIFNAFQRTGLEAKQESVYAMVDIGAKFSNMNIVAKGQPYFTRDILWGGMDAGNAEKPVFEKFVSEARMSFDYFETQFGKNVERLYISGGGSCLLNIRDFLKENLGIEVILWNPFDGIKIPDDASGNKEIRDFPAQFAVAVGLALRK